MLKRQKLYFILFFSLIFTVSIGFYVGKKVEDHKGWYNLYLRILCKTGISKKIIQSDCGFNEKQDSNEKIVLSLRDFVFRSTKRGEPTPESVLEPEHRYFYAHYSPPLVQNCGGCELEFEYLLTEFGIPYRQIQLASASFFNGTNGNTHVASEVFLNNKWVFMDPTFNCHWNCSDGRKNLSLQEINSCITDGSSLIVQEGPSKIKGYDIANYYIDFKDFIYAYQVFGADDKLGPWQYFHQQK